MRTAYHEKNTDIAAATGDSIVEEILEKWLADWSGLRLYILRRRAGGEADSTMDTLLGELLGMRIGRREAAESLRNQLLTPAIG